MSSDLHTINLRLLLQRYQGGDAAALDELLRLAGGRLETLARAMLRRYPSVRDHEQTGDVLQEAILSMMSALRKLSFASTREFYGLVAEHLRRRLIDFARRHAQPHRSHSSFADGESDLVPAPGANDELDRWQALHEAAAALPADQREVFGLRFYHGWSNPQIAELLQVSEKTVSRLWARAAIELTRRLGGRPLPASDEAGHNGGKTTSTTPEA